MQEPLTPAAKALDLPDNQLLALEALVAGKNRTEAAETAGVTRKTVHRWLLDPVFLAALHQARCEAWTEVTGELHAQGLHAVRTLVAVLDCDQPRARVLAARAVLDLSAKAIELETSLPGALSSRPNWRPDSTPTAAEAQTPTPPPPTARPTHRPPKPPPGLTRPPARSWQRMVFNVAPGFQPGGAAKPTQIRLGSPTRPTARPENLAKNVTSWDMPGRSPLAASFSLAARSLPSRDQRSAA